MGSDDNDALDAEHRAQGFTAGEREAVYRAIHSRRDVRSNFLGTPVPAPVLARLLDAAHHAPSVGLMQPWRFVVVEDIATRRRVRESFVEENRAAGADYDDERRALYGSLKLEGILEAPLNICVICDPDAARGHGLGRRTMPETAIYSTVCAVQNFWLAARAEGIGVGWVSILSPDRLRAALAIPDGIVPVAYLCVGYVSGFGDVPDLAARGWEQRAALRDLVHFDRYGATDAERARALFPERAGEPTRET